MLKFIYGLLVWSFKSIYLSCPVGTLTLGVEAGRGDRESSVHFSPLLSPSPLWGRAQRQRLGLETPSHLLNVTWALEEDDPFLKTTTTTSEHIGAGFR